MIKNMIEFDSKSLRDVLTDQGKTAAEVSRSMGFSESFLSVAMNRGTISMSAAKLLCFQLDIPLSRIQKKPAATPKTAASSAYTAQIDVTGGKSLNMSLYFGGEKICEAYSKIKGPDKLDLMQAISYAAHMMYKLVEQDTLRASRKQ